MNKVRGPALFSSFGQQLGTAQVDKRVSKAVLEGGGEGKVCGGGKKFARGDGELVLDGAPRSRKTFNNIWRIQYNNLPKKIPYGGSHEKCVVCKHFICQFGESLALKLPPRL